ncbi:hypothetical protein D3M57_18265 [Klebsiella pneumoniae]|nr:hypothetical protein [Klebsiella pneumoniae]
MATVEVHYNVQQMYFELLTHARRMLADDQLDLVLLDELTYMVALKYPCSTAVFTTLARSGSTI